MSLYKKEGSDGDTAIRDAAAEDLDKINHLLRLSKAYWGYDKEFLDRFMQNLGVTHAYLNKHNVKLFYIGSQFTGFF